MDGKPPERLSKIIGTYKMGNFILDITNSPTRKRSFGVGEVIIKNEFPEDLWRKTSLALEQFLLKQFYKKMKKAGFSWIEFQRPTSFLVKRSGIKFDVDKIYLRFHFRPPLRKNRVNGKLLAKGFEKVLPKVVNESLSEVIHRNEEIRMTKNCLEDQIAVKAYLRDNGYTMFIPNEIVFGNYKIRLKGNDVVKTPHSGKVKGVLINGGSVWLANCPIELSELIAKSYAYRKCDDYTSLLKSVNDFAFIGSQDVNAVEYFGVKKVFSIENLGIGKQIYINNTDGDPAITIDMKTGEVTKTGKNESVMKNEIISLSPPEFRKVKLVDNTIWYEDNKITLPFTFASTIIEKSQLRGLVDAVNLSKRYATGRDVKALANKVISVVNKDGLRVLGLGFYTEFTGWQLFYILWRMALKSSQS